LIIIFLFKIGLYPFNFWVTILMKVLL
jgi:hypothetical protein